MSPAICSIVNWSNGMFWLSASITQLTLADRRDRRPLRRDERPVFLPGSALLDPAANQLDLRLAQLLAGLRGRHAFVNIDRGNALPQQAFLQLARSDDGERSVLG